MTYCETQKFKQPWIWIVLILSGVLVLGIFGMGIYRQIICRVPMGNHPMSDGGLIVIAFLMLALFSGLFYLLLSLKMTTLIDESGIRYRMYPFHIKYRLIRWDQLEKCEVVQYNPLLDYGGWGIRYGKKGKAFNVAGNKGLQLTLKKGEPILLGTQKPLELAEFLKQQTGTTAVNTAGCRTDS